MTESRDDDGPEDPGDSSSSSGSSSGSTEGPRAYAGLDFAALFRTVAHSPGWQLVIGGFVLALLFPSRLPGSFGLTCVAGGIGVGVARWWHLVPEAIRKPGDTVATAFVVTLVIALGLSVFWDTMTVSPDWHMGDWGPQHAVLRNILPSLPGIDTPVWNHLMGTGDAPLELYPELAYLVVGNFACLSGLENDLPLAMMIVAVIVHIGIATTTTLIAIRVAPRPVALIVGLVAVVDTGGVAHGGSTGLFRWGLLHSAMALLFATIATLGVLGALRRPRLQSSIAIWVGTALACATHPIGLIAVASSAVGLLAVALLASDVPPRRAMIAIGHLALGVAIGACVWMPLAERILDYGQHFPNALRTPARLLEDLLQAPAPATAFAMLMYAGYFGILAGLWSRRAAPVYVAAVALVLLVGLCDAPYLALDLAPGRGIARLGTERLAMMARPLIAAAGAYGISIWIGHAIAAWRGASARRRVIAAAVIGVFAASVLRIVPSLWRATTSRAHDETEWVAADPFGRLALTLWAHGQVAKMTPDRFGRALFELDTHEHFHLTAETGLPTLHLGPQPALLLRERIEDMTPSSLRRFDIRWVIGVDRSPTFGDPESEFTLGTFHIRTVKNWDGKFARIERGHGTVEVTRLDSQAVEVVVHADEPVLVALGTGYYPRWRATHETGANEPVFAMRATPIANLSVVSAWVAPGKTTFTADAPLPSDGKGRWLSILALLVAGGAIVTWSVRRFRIRWLRRIAKARARLPDAARLARIGVPVVLGGLVIRGCAGTGGPVAALEVGDGLRGNATVEARLADGEWQTCDYQRIQGVYACEGLLVAYDGMTALLNDATPSWGFNTPGIVASADTADVEMRIRFREHLAGTYWTASSGGEGILSVSDEADRVLEPAIVSYADIGTRTIEVRAPIPTTWWQFTFVREDTMLPPRDYPAPPESWPPEVFRIPWKR